MSKKRHTPKQIISKLREAEILLSQGQSVPVARSWRIINSRPQVCFRHQSLLN